MTSRQRDILNFIDRYARMNWTSPSMERIARGVGLSSKSSVHAQVEKLVAYGYLECRRSDYNVVQYRLTDMAYDAGCGERPAVD